jgi:glycosyltransferase involved in cell wall biosynthesis
MRILHVTPAYYPASYWGGPIFSVYGLNKALAAMPEVQLKVITTDSAGPRREDCLDTHALDHNTLYPNYTVCFTHRLAGYSASLELLLKLPALVWWADIVHLSAIYSFPTIPTLLLCRIWRKPLVWSPHGTFLTDKKRVKTRRKSLKRLWLYVCNVLVRPDWLTLHATSNQEKIACLPQIRNTRTVVIPNGVETLQVLPRRIYLPEGKMRLLYIGRLDPIKGIENLLDAMKRLDDPSISLAIYGSGNAQYGSSLKQYAERLDLLGSRVNFFGQVDGEAKVSAFLNSDVSVFPSYSESFAMVVAESLAHGVPVIASRETPWKSVEDKQCGLWVDNTPESLAFAVRSVRKMRLAEMGKRGWEWMKDEFGWETIGGEMLELYRSSRKFNDDHLRSQLL